MRYLMVGIVLAALSAGAMAQSSDWGFFGGPGMASGAAGCGARAFALAPRGDGPSAPFRPDDNRQSKQRHAAVDTQVDAGHKAACVGCKEERGARQFAGLT